jgi:hypothetical protein
MLKSSDPGYLAHTWDVTSAIFFISNTRSDIPREHKDRLHEELRHPRLDKTGIGVPDAF